MSSLGSPNPFFIAGKKAYEVERSLRFNDNDTAYLSRTPSSAGDRKKWTFSAWIKRANLGGSAGEMRIFGGNANASHIYFASNDEITWDLANEGSGSSSGNLNTTQVFRDVGAWFHLVCALDTDNSTADNRMRIYINGTEVTSYGSRSNPSSGYATNAMNNNTLHTLGYRTSGQGSAGMEFDGYMAEINFIDGQQYDPSYFGETDPITGQWNPKKYVGGYGTTGFYLNFSDNSGTTATTLGKDYSGNDNNFTPNNFVTGDAVKDSPTNNFCTLNPLNANKNRGQASFFEGNLRMTSTSGNRGFTTGTMKAQGKIYFEVLNKSNSGFVGISEIDRGTHQSLDFYQGTPRIDGSAQSGTGQFSSGDIMGVKVDIDAKSIEFYRNGSSVYSTTYTTDAEYFPFIEDTSGGRSTDAIANFGQDSSFAGEKTAQGNTDANGKGDFYYSVPSGFKAICSANLPDPTIKRPNKHFDTLLYTGDGASSKAITGLNFSPDWVWTKRRSGTDNHMAFDSVRGASTARLFPNLTSAEDGNFGSINSFDSNGFTVGANVGTNANGQTFVAWNWNAGDTDGKTYAVTVVSDSGNKYRFDGFGTSAVTLDLAEGGTYIFDQSDSSNAGHPLRFYTAADKTGGEYTTGVTTAGTPGSSGAYTQIVVAASAPTLFYQCSVHAGMGGQANTNSTLGSSNFDGSKQTVVKANASAGFSIIKYTGDGSSGASTGHGLGVAPKIMFHKNRDGANNWYTITTAIDGSPDYLYLNTTASALNSSVTAPTSSLVYFTASTESNANGTDYIMYAFSEVEGYSKFGSYVGNNNADGTFVFTGFRPAWIMMKETSSTSRWSIYDNKRDTTNPNTTYLRAQASNGDTINSNNAVDFLSNGFKMRTGSSNEPNAAHTYIYLAFAEAPFRNARAR